MEDMIIAAIDHRTVLSLTYDGQSRMVNPHALYRDVQHRRLVLLAWQTDGGSNSGMVPGWKNFHVNEISDLEVSDERFYGAQGDFDPRHYRNMIHSL